MDTLSSRGSAAGIFDVFILSTSSTRSGCGPAQLDLASIPTPLRTLVAKDAVQATAYTTILGTDASTPPRPGLVVGAPVSSGPTGYQVYYLFPLDSETETLSLVRRTLAVAGVVLAILLAGIAALVTRQVVIPVRTAARTAGRLAAGFLEERLDVRGRDDLARLATSFNDMAASLQRQIVRLEELSRVQRRFVSDVSHELRTPLTTVRMAADVLHAARADFPASVARSAELLQAELDRFEALLADLLEISRYDAGAADLDLTPSDVTELVAAGAQPRWRRWRSGAAPRWCCTPRTSRSPPRWTAGGWCGWSATSSATPSSTARAARWRSSSPGTRARSRCSCATRGSACAPARPTGCSTGSGGPTPAGPGTAAAPASGCPSRSRTRGCTAGGCRRGGSPGSARPSA